MDLKPKQPLGSNTISYFYLHQSRWGAYACHIKDIHEKSKKIKINNENYKEARNEHQGHIEFAISHGGMSFPS